MTTNTVLKVFRWITLLAFFAMVACAPNEPDKAKAARQAAHEREGGFRLDIPEKSTESEQEKKRAQAAKEAAEAAKKAQQVIK